MEDAPYIHQFTDMEEKIMIFITQMYKKLSSCTDVRNVGESVDHWMLITHMFFWKCQKITVLGNGMQSASTDTRI